MDLTTTTKPNKCALLELPPEIRIYIHENIRGDDNNRRRECSLVIRDDNRIEAPQLSFLSFENIEALRRTCKALYNEVAPVFYEGISFKIQLYGNKKPTPLMRNTLGTLGTLSPLL